MQQLSNCPKCGKLFIRIRNICPECFQEQENEYLKVAAFLRENRGSTLQEVVDATKVSIAQIRNYILTGRIILTDLPNLKYPCESCGTMINRGKACDSCIQTIQQLAADADKRINDDAKEQAGKYTGYRSRL